MACDLVGYWDYSMFNQILLEFQEGFGIEARDAYLQLCGGFDEEYLKEDVDLFYIGPHHALWKILERMPAIARREYSVSDYEDLCKFFVNCAKNRELRIAACRSRLSEYLPKYLVKSWEPMRNFFIRKMRI